MATHVMTNKEDKGKPAVKYLSSEITRLISSSMLGNLDRLLLETPQNMLEELASYLQAAVDNEFLPEEELTTAYNSLHNVIPVAIAMLVTDNKVLNVPNVVSVWPIYAAEGFTKGAGKYGKYSWMQFEFTDAIDAFGNAAYRHLVKHILDKYSKSNDDDLYHWVHLISNLYALYYHIHTNKYQKTKAENS